MACAMTVEQYLEQHEIPYDVMQHPAAPTSLKTAMAADIPADWMAKAVILEDERGYVMAIIPASHQVSLRRLRAMTGRQMHTAQEPELAPLFRDCVLGAVPPLGMAYGLDMIWDDSLKGAHEIYFEAGDHESLMHVRGSDFMQMMADAPHGDISSHI